MPSIKEQILQEVETTLGAMTTAGGYSMDSPYTSRRTRPADRLPDYPAIFISEPEEEKESGPVAKTSTFMPVRIECWLYDDRQTPNLNATNALRDLEYALLQDATRGGLAIDTTLVRNKMLVTEQKMSGVMLDVEVHFRHAYMDPGVA